MLTKMVPWMGSMRSLTMLQRQQTLMVMEQVTMLMHVPMTLLRLLLVSVVVAMPTPIPMEI